MMDKPHEECGLFGVYDPAGQGVADETYLALYALQHRGQESAGIAVNDDGVISFHKDVGLVPEVFDEKTLKELGGGKMAVGHVRYSPGSKQERASAQPLVMRYVKGTIAIGHNGAIANFEEIRQELEKGGAIFQTNCDAELIAYVIARERLTAGSVERAVQNMMDKVKGAYSLVLMSPSKLIGARDPHGFRPLSIGKMGDSYMLASETCAFDSLGAEFIRDVKPGEVVVIDENGLQLFYNRPCFIAPYRYDSSSEGGDHKQKIQAAVLKHHSLISHAGSNLRAISPPFAKCRIPAIAKEEIIITHYLRK